LPSDKYSGYWRLMQDYFHDLPVYGDNYFRHQLVSFHGLFFGAYECENLYSLTCTSMYSFRMCKAMFIDICHAVAARSDYFKRKPNAAGLSRFTTIQMVIAALRMLAYGGSADCLDEYFRMGKTTILESPDHFTRTVVDLYGQSYLRPPNAEDIARFLQKAEERWFPHRIGSIYCMHWE
jgi:nicotinic acid phosphoribosyltransferase